MDLGEVRGPRLLHRDHLRRLRRRARGARVAAGGRYDGLLARFGRPGPAIGFAIDLEFATQALERKNGRGRSAPPRAGGSSGGQGERRRR